MSSSHVHKPAGAKKFAIVLSIAISAMPLIDQPMSHLDSCRVTRALIRRLDSGDKNTQLETLSSLRKRNDPAAIPSIMEKLESGDETIASNAAAALIAMGQSATMALVEVLDGENNGNNVRLKAIFILGQIGDAWAAPHLIKILGSDDRNSLKQACEALIAIGDDAAPALLQAFRDRATSPKIRSHAADILAMLRITEAIPAFVGALDDDHKWVRGAAEDALEAIGSDAVPALLAKLDDGRITDRTKEGIVRILGKIGDARSVPILLKKLDDKDAGVDLRKLIAEALGEIGDMGSVDALSRIALESDGKESDNTRSAAIEALGQIAKKNGGYAPSRQNPEARGSLAYWKLTALVPDLLNISNERNLEKNLDLHSDLVFSSLYALGKIGDPRAINTLYRIGGSNFNPVQEYAIAGLKDIGSAETVRPLLKLLEEINADYSNYSSILRPALIISGKTDVPALMKVLDNKAKGERVRAEIAFILGEIGDESAISALERAAKDKSDFVRSSSLKALNRIRGIEPDDPESRADRDKEEDEQ